MKGRNLEKIKKDYKAIPIPEDLKTMVEKTMKTAKQEIEREEKEMKKGVKVRKYITRTVGTVAAAMLTITILSNSSASISYAIEKIPVIGVIAKVVTFRTYEDQNKDMSANIKTPQLDIQTKDGVRLEDTTKELNKTVKEYTDQVIAMYKADVESTGGEGKEEVTTDYEIVTDNDSLFSLRIDTVVSLNTSGITIKIYHVDKKSGEIITLKDIFKENTDYLDIITNNIKEQMKEQMKKDDSVSYWVDSEMPEMDWTGLTEEANFYVNSKGKLVFVFDKYEVAPGAMGVREFEIPTEIISNIIKDGYLK